MAVFNYQDLEQVNRNASERSQVEFFSLKNNRDEAIVRFAFDTLDQLEFVTVHNVSVGGKYRKANCPRGLFDGADKCPLCQAKMPVQQRVFVKLIQYNLDQRDPRGKPTYVAKIWERSANYAKTLQSYINNYGNLSDYVFKIVRNGNAGDTKTTYDIMPCMPQLYPTELYAKDFSAFENYSVVGTVVIDEDYAGLQRILNGTWQPKTAEVAQQTVGAPVLTTPTSNPVWTPTGPTVVLHDSNTHNQQAQTTTTFQENRPKRTYSY